MKEQDKAMARDLSEAVIINMSDGEYIYSNDHT